MAKLEIKDVHKSFGKNHVVKGINLSIGDGEFLCLLGPLRLRQDHPFAHDRRPHRDRRGPDHHQRQGYD